MENKTKSKKLSVKFISVIGFCVIALFSFLIVFIGGRVQSAVYDSTVKDIEIIVKSYSESVGQWLDESLSEMAFYTNSNVVWEGGSSDEIGEWLATTESRRSKNFNYVLFIAAEGNSYYDSGKTGFHGDRAYYKKIMTDGAEFVITDPTLAKATGIVSIMIVKAAYDSYGRKVGMFVGVKQIDSIQTKINSFSLGESGYAFMLDGTGIVMCHPNSSYQMEANFVNGDFPKEVITVANEMISGNSGKDYIVSGNGLKSKELVIFEPVKNTKWSIAVCVPESQLNKTARNLQLLLIIFNSIIAVIILGLITFMITGELRPLVVVNKSIKSIASGNADLTQRIEVKSKNEIGAVAVGFNEFMEKLQGIIGQIKYSKESLASIDENLQASTQDTGTSIQEIVHNIDSVKKIIIEQTDSVDGTASAITQIASNIQSMEKMIENQASGVTEASAAVEEMIGNINAINGSIEKMAEEFVDLQEKAVLGTQKQSSVNDKINEIENQSAMLQEANMAISAIAEQTNLLAMNAAIEAAHAGEAGKGFSVVADEIRKLSETSSGQSKTIGEQLQKIKESIENVVASSSESSEAFQSVSASIRETDELVRQIRGAMQEQAEGSKQVLESLQLMSDSTNSVKDASQEMSAGSNQILSEVARLKNSSGDLKLSVTEMNSSAVKIKETGHALTEISAQMNENIRKIGNEIDLFKV